MLTPNHRNWIRHLCIGVTLTGSLFLSPAKAQFELAPDYIISVFGGVTVPASIAHYQDNNLAGLHGGGVFLFRYSNFFGIGGMGTFNTLPNDNLVDKNFLKVKQTLNVAQLAPVIRLKTPDNNIGYYSFLDFAPSMYQESLIKTTAGKTTWKSYTDLGLHGTGGILINHFLLQMSVDWVHGNYGQIFWINLSVGIGT